MLGKLRRPLSLRTAVWLAGNGGRIRHAGATVQNPVIILSE
jgi:hypothetical protein